MKQLLVILLLLCTIGIFAQDVIVKKDGSTVVCRVVELTESEIVYKKWSDLNGSNYVMERSAASTINYQDGKKVNLSGATNLYNPNDQNDGVQQYNDRALVALDAASRNSRQKIKTLKSIGWLGGSVLVAIGILVADSEEEFIPYIGGGVVFTGTFLILANYEKKKSQRLESSSILKYDFDFGNNSILSAGIDMLRDRTTGVNTLGLGLRYSF